MENVIPMTSEPTNGTVFVEATLRVLGGKWKLLILWHLKDTAQRYSTLKRLIPNISEKMLIQQLRELMSDGIISRQVLSEMPPKVEYVFTDYGRTLIPVLETLCAWGIEHARRLQVQTED
jgi:DNA-binding HxlR family transcriptional regulator